MRTRRERWPRSQALPTAFKGTGMQKSQQSGSSRGLRARRDEWCDGITPRIYMSLFHPTNGISENLFWCDSYCSPSTTRSEQGECHCIRSSDRRMAVPVFPC